MRIYKLLYLGIARMNMGIYEGAIGYFEQQLATLEQLSSHTSLIDKVNKKYILENIVFICS